MVNTQGISSATEILGNILANELFIGLLIFIIVLIIAWTQLSKSLIIEYRK